MPRGCCAAVAPSAGVVLASNRCGAAAPPNEDVDATVAGAGLAPNDNDAGATTEPKPKFGTVGAAVASAGAELANGRALGAFDAVGG